MSVMLPVSVNKEVLLISSILILVLIVAVVLRGRIGKELIRVVFTSFLTGLMFTIMKLGFSFGLFEKSINELSGWDIAFIVFFSSLVGWFIAALIAGSSSPDKKV